MIFLPTIRCPHLPSLIKCLDHKLTCPCTQGLQVLIFDYLQPSFSLLLLSHAKGRSRFPEAAGIKHFRAGSSIISILQVHYCPSRLITSSAFKEIGDLEGINKYIITLVQLHSCLILSHLKEAIHWIQLSRAHCYSLALRWCHPLLVQGTLPTRVIGTRRYLKGSNEYIRNEAQRW